VLLWRGRAARAVLSYAVGFALLLGWWSTIAPSQNRTWADDVARQVRSRADGSVVTLDNVRNFDWRSDTDYTPRWETRRYDLDRCARSTWRSPTGAAPPSPTRWCRSASTTGAS
jgi:hypothetical protein